MVTVIKRFACDICRSEFRQEEDAHQCEAVGLIGVNPDIKVGDFVEASFYKAYAWHNKPDSIWTRLLTPEEKAKTHHGALKYTLRFIVTHIGTIPGRGQRDGHHVSYSIFCPEPPRFLDGAGGWHAWTRFGTHTTIYKIEETPEFLAWKAENFHEWEGKPASILL